MPGVAAGGPAWRLRARRVAPPAMEQPVDVGDALLQLVRRGPACRTSRTMEVNSRGSAARSTPSPRAR
jgi:hypothetical protein